MNLLEPFIMLPALDVLGSVLKMRFPLAIPSFILISCAAKLPVLSRFTMAFAVLRFVAALAKTAPAATFAAVCPPTVLTTVALCVPVTSPVNEPEKLVAVVAVVALPLKLAVMVPAEKLPDESRTTISLATLALDIAAKLAFVIVAGVMSAFTMSDVDKSPAALLCTTPTVLNPSIVTPEGLIFICSTPLTSKESVLAVAADSPVLVLPVN